MPEHKRYGPTADDRPPPLPCYHCQRRRRRLMSIIAAYTQHAPPAILLGCMLSKTAQVPESIDWGP